MSTAELASPALIPLQPAALAKMLPPDHYLSERWFERERAVLHDNAWHFACLASSLTQPGDFRVRQLLDRSVLIIKGEDGNIRAFLNTCRHRAAPLTNARCGRLEQLRCPFHHWTYSTEGKLLKAPGLANVCAPQQLSELGLDLVPLPCSSAAGLVFVNLNPANQTPLTDSYGSYLTSIAEPHRCADMRLVHEKHYILNTNWKLYVEVDMETLHTNFIHSRSIGSQAVEPILSQSDWFGVYHRNQQSPALFPEKRHLAFPAPDGIDGDAKAGTHFCILLPGFFIVTAPEVMWWIQKTPISAQQCQVHVGYAFHKDTLARPDFNDIAPLYFERLDQVIKEDDAICEYQIQGLHNGIQGHFTPMEPVAAHFCQLMQQRLAAAGFL